MEPLTGARPKGSTVLNRKGGRVVFSPTSLGTVYFLAAAAAIAGGAHLAKAARWLQYVG